MTRLRGGEKTMTDPGIETEIVTAATGSPRHPWGAVAGRPGVPRYESPRLFRVRIETTRLVAGFRTSTEHCTQHFHANVPQCGV